MELNFTLLLIFCWTLIVVVCAGTDLEVKVTPSIGLDPKTTPALNNNSNVNEKPDKSESVVDSKKVDPVNKEKDQVGGSKEGVQDSKLDETITTEHKQVGSKEENIEKKDKNGSEDKGETKIISGKTSDIKEGDKEGSVTLPAVRKERSPGEECDVSNSCNDEKKTLVACLRVPGNESPDLSLLIQNKGKGPLSVNISAPNYVRLEKAIIQIEEEQNEKVRVSIRNGGTGTLIVLTAGHGNCSLDLRDFVSVIPRKETTYTTKSAFINYLKRTPFFAYIIFAALVFAAILVSTWMCFSVKGRQSNGNDSKYQKLDMELPVSGGGKVGSDLNDGWDNNWDDDWDDEEAPKTPSMPVTPSLSAKGLASRRVKGWKD